MSIVEKSELRIRPILANDKLDKLSLGNKNHKALKSFLKKSALGFHNNNMTKTYVLVDDSRTPRVWGYMSLRCSEIKLEGTQKPNECEKFEKYDHFPSIKLARLAIDKSLQKQGYGSELLSFAIATIVSSIMPAVGCRFIILDSKVESVSFYQKHGFKLLDASQSQGEKGKPIMFLDLQTAIVKKTTELEIVDMEGEVV